MKPTSKAVTMSALYQKRRKSVSASHVQRGASEDRPASRASPHPIKKHVPSQLPAPKIAVDVDRRTPSKFVEKAQIESDREGNYGRTSKGDQLTTKPKSVGGGSGGAKNVRSGRSDEEGRLSSQLAQRQDNKKSPNPTGGAKIDKTNALYYYYYHPTLWEQMKSLQCLRVLRAAYHKYGVKHLFLLIILIGYSFMGAGIFLLLEQPAEQLRLKALQAKLVAERKDVVGGIMYDLFNDTEHFLFFLSPEQSAAVEGILQKSFRKYESVVTAENFRYGVYNEMRWDFWNSMLYAWTIITTIGYGYLHPTTDKGKVITMIYAIFGIPLFLSVLNDLGKVLTKVMKYPFFLAKKYARRLFQYCTRMSRDQIKEAEAKDKARLEVFDLPVPLAIGIVIGWIFVCSAITLTWENDWDYLIAFYFFFISLSTIGFGDVMPSDPRYLLIMFGNIVIGLALVSMCINLIQGKLEKTYQTTNNNGGANQRRSGDRSVDEDSADEISDHGGFVQQQLKQTNGSLKKFFQRASQISLSGMSGQSRQMSQTSLHTSDETPAPPPPAQVAYDPTTPHRRKSSKPPSPVPSKKTSRASPTPSEPSRHVDTQTMLSIVAGAEENRGKQPYHVINVTNQRGTVRSLPGTTSFNEIDRLVDLNINAELLRNELIDIETFHNILSPQEVLAQIHHERQLHPINL